MAGPAWPSLSPQSTHWLSPASVGSVWLFGCLTRCSLTISRPSAPTPDRGTCLCTNPLAFPPLTPLRSLGQWSQVYPIPGPLSFSSHAFPRTRKPTEQCFWTEGALLWALDCPEPRPVLLPWVVTKSARSGLWGRVGPVASAASLCRALYPNEAQPCRELCPATDFTGFISFSVGRRGASMCKRKGPWGALG